jgi:TetR/AcrR family transcriptional regulator, transcriptional repressor for nem operon
VAVDAMIEHLRMTAPVNRIAGLLDGGDRQRRSWSIVVMMVGPIVISRGMPDQSETRTTPLDSALSTASTLIEAGTDDGRTT